MADALLGVRLDDLARRVYDFGAFAFDETVTPLAAYSVVFSAIGAYLVIIAALWVQIFFAPIGWVWRFQLFRVDCLFALLPCSSLSPSLAGLVLAQLLSFSLENINS